MQAAGAVALAATEVKVAWTSLAHGVSRLAGWSGAGVGDVAAALAQVTWTSCAHGMSGSASPRIIVLETG